MHPYSTDLDERRPTLFVLVLFSIVAAWMLSKGVAALGKTIPWWADAPSIWGFYGIFYWVVDRWGWRGISRLPNLNGTWRGYMTSSFDEHAERHAITMRIQQTWTKLRVTLEADRSRSHSVLGGILTSSLPGPELAYEYVNEPRADAAAGMHAHHGIVRAQIRGDVLDGDYYTGRDRASNGVLRVERVRSARSRDL